MEHKLDMSIDDVCVTPVTDKSKLTSFLLTLKKNRILLLM